MDFKRKYTFLFIHSRTQVIQLLWFRFCATDFENDLIHDFLALGLKLSANVITFRFFFCILQHARFRGSPKLNRQTKKKITHTQKSTIQTVSYHSIFRMMNGYEQKFHIFSKRLQKLWIEKKETAYTAAATAATVIKRWVEKNK